MIYLFLAVEIAMTKLSILVDLLTIEPTPEINKEAATSAS
jgi:hypothetical protein